LLKHVLPQPKFHRREDELVITWFLGWSVLNYHLAIIQLRCSIMQPWWSTRLHFLWSKICGYQGRSRRVVQYYEVSYPPQAKLSFAREVWWRRLAFAPTTKVNPWRLPILQDIIMIFVSVASEVFFTYMAPLGCRWRCTTQFPRNDRAQKNSSFLFVLSGFSAHRGMKYICTQSSW
jgi:hypothetical protein